MLQREVPLKTSVQPGNTITLTAPFAVASGDGSVKASPQLRFFG